MDMHLGFFLLVPIYISSLSEQIIIHYCILLCVTVKGPIQSFLSQYQIVLVTCAEYNNSEMLTYDPLTNNEVKKYR